MAASQTSEARHEEWAQPRATTDGEPLSTRAAWLWTLVGLALLGGFLALLLEDFPLRSLIATQ